MDGLGGGLKRNLPAGKHDYRRVAVKGTSKNLGTLNTKINSTVFDSGNGCLRDAR